MSKEEKMEILEKLNTQIDGVEAYTRQLANAESGEDRLSQNTRDVLNTITLKIRSMREWLELYERFVKAADIKQRSL